jgi:hypothetical protein
MFTDFQIFLNEFLCRVKSVIVFNRAIEKIDSVKGFKAIQKRKAMYDFSTNRRVLRNPYFVELFEYCKEGEDSYGTKEWMIGFLKELNVKSSRRYGDEIAEMLAELR